MTNKGLREKATRLRKLGKTYSEIRKKLKIEIPKSTMSYWFKGISLTNLQKERISKSVFSNIEKARKKALLVNKIKREKYLKSVYNRNKHLNKSLKNKDIGKITLSILYLGEGKKKTGGSLTFGNSDPFIISLFLHLLRQCYNIEESKFRCTVMCRADQNTKELEKFWRNITKIPSNQFYKTRIDPRTIGKPSRKLDYKGVCCVDYFSSDTYTELMQIPKIIYKEGS